MSLFQKILVPTDFSPHAEDALRLASELAKSSQATLCLVHVYDLTPISVPEGMTFYNASALAHMRNELTRRLTDVQRTALTAGVREVEMKLMEGQPYREIVRAAEDTHAQLIVMGSHGRTGLAHILLGSVAERVVRKAPCPVIVVPCKEQAATAALAGS
jgi:nucleotide-binding universal stress UspA family protein